MHFTVSKKTFLRDRITRYAFHLTPGSNSRDQIIAIYPAGNPHLINAIAPALDGHILIQFASPINGRREWFVEESAIDLDVPKPTTWRGKSANTNSAE